MKKRRLAIVIWILSMVVALGAGIFALTEDCNHDWSDWTVVTQSTCSKEGVKTRKCARCREVQEAEVEKLPHTPGQTTVTKKATCLEDGVKTTKCKVCSQVAYTTPITARGYHTYEEDFSKRVNATCTVDGSRTLVCTECDSVRKEKIPAVGHHSWDDSNPTYVLRPAVSASCETEGYTEHKECTRCGAKNSEYQMTAPKHPNTPEKLDEGVEMCCLTNTVGYTPGRQCPDCGVWVEGHETIPVQHTLSETGWTEVTQSTCTVKGQKTQTCSTCKTEIVEALPLLDHSFTKTVEAKQATCVEDGWTRHKICENCGKQDSSYQIKEKVGHTFDEYGCCKVEKCGTYTYEFLPNGDGTYSLSKLIVGDGDTRNYFEIPAKVKGTEYPVTGVLSSACEELAITHNFKIKLPESIVFIGASAFENCAKLVEVENLDLVKYIGERAFEGCSALKSVKLDGVLSIGDSAFKDCTALENVVLPETVETVGYMAFKGCKKLNSLTVAYIGSTENDGREFGYIFGSNRDVPTSLKYVTVLKTTKVIPANAFAGIGGVQEITLPTTVETIEENAFARCVSLASIRIGENANINDFSAIKEIGAKAFESVKFAKITLPFIGEKENGEYTNFGYVFADENEDVPQSLKEVSIVKSTVIAPYAFSGSNNLETITLSGDVKKIGESAFNGCASLKEVVYNAETVTEMGVMAFAGCDSLESLTLPFIGEKENGENTNFGYVFNGSIGNANIPESLATVIVLRGTKIGDKAFENCSDIVKLTIPEVTAIGMEAFKGCSSLKEIRYGENGEKNYLAKTILSIGKSAFEGCFEEGFNDEYDWELGQYVRETLSLTLPFVGRDSGINEMEEDETIGYIFGSNEKMPNRLVEIVLLDGAQGESVIAQSAFEGCVYLEKITLGNNVNEISADAFKDCTAITSVLVPENVEMIDFGAFQGCTAIESISLPFVGKSKTAKSGEQHFGWIFGIDTSGKHAKESYKMPEAFSVTLTSAQQILNWAFIDCVGLTQIVIPSTVKVLDNETFMNCENLERVEFVTVQGVAWELKEIGDSAFANCKNLKELELPASVDVLEENVFLYCSALERIATQGNKNGALVVRSIGFGAFRFAFLAPSTSPDVVNTPIVVRLEGVESIGEKAFLGSNATVLEISNIPADKNNVTSARELKEILKETFRESKYLTTLVLPDTVETIENYAVAECDKLTAFRMPKSISVINSYAFSDCPELTVLNDNDEEIMEFSRGVRIGNSAFENCVKLKELAFTFELDFNKPEKVTIGMKAFAGCTNLEFVYLPYDEKIVADGSIKVGVTSIASNAFGRCGIDLDGNMFIYYHFDLSGEAWDAAWHEGASLGQSNKYLLELEDLNEDGKLDYNDYKLAKSAVKKANN